MTNNKKKSERSTERKAKIEAKVAGSTSKNGSSTSDKIMPQVQPGVFTNGQLASLIFLSIGLSRLMQLRSMFPISSSATSTSHDETNVEVDNNDAVMNDLMPSLLQASPVCINYLGSVEVCGDATIHTLMQYKYQTAIQTFGIVGAVLLQIWKTEHLVRKLLTVFTIAPIALGLATLYICHDPEHKVLPFSIFMEQLLMGIVLIILSFTGWYLLTTDPGKRATESYKSIPNICLAVLIFTWFYDAMKLIYDETELHGDDAVLQLFDASLGSYNFWYAAKPFVYFIAIDKICAAFVTTFVWYYLPDPRQRNFLFCVCVMKLLEFFYQLPPFEKDILNYSTLRVTTVIFAIISGCTWLSPTEIRWINNNNNNNKDNTTVAATEDFTSTATKAVTQQTNKVKST